MMFKQLIFAASAIAMSSAAFAGFSDRVGTQYVNLSAGANMLNDTDFVATGAVIDSEYDTGFALAAETGYNFGQYLFVDNVKLGLEAAYTQNDVDVHSSGGSQLANSTGELDAFTFMANMTHEFNTGTQFVPYYGVGAGVAAVDASNFGVTGVENALDDDDNAFAYQANLGVNYMVNPALDLGVNYRYAATAGLEMQGLGAEASDFDYQSNNFTFNLNYRY